MGRRSAGCIEPTPLPLAVPTAVTAAGLLPAGTDPTTAFLVAIALIIVTAQLLGALMERWAQPRVIGEILGGIALGPSLLGVVAPQLEQRLFGPAVLTPLNLLGQLGLALYMLLLGLELNPGLLQGRLAVATRITLAGVGLPLLLGIGLAEWLETWQPGLLPGDHSLAGALFLGTAMAITAFPVLARVLEERQLSDGPLGTLTISVAAVDDLLSWMLLAAVVAFARSGSAWGALTPLLLTTAWAALLLLVVRPRLEGWLARQRGADGELGALAVMTLLAGGLLSGALTQAIGVHLIFGAFLWGVALPRDAALQRQLRQQLDVTVLQLLLPLFFAVSGLNTTLIDLHSPALWAVTALVLSVAVAGKFSGTWLTARLSGVPPRQARAIGWLMNTRGLTELVILNVGLNLGLISRTLFSIGVLMAIGTTVMTGPLLDQLGYRRQAPGDRL